MPNRLCIDCQDVTTSTRCTSCAKARDKARGTSTERGYGAEHQARLRAPEHLEATHCTTCLEAFADDNPKTGGHVVDLRTGTSDGTLKPECQDCNYGWRRNRQDSGSPSGP